MIPPRYSFTRERVTYLTVNVSAEFAPFHSNDQVTSIDLRSWPGRTNHGSVPRTRIPTVSRGGYFPKSTDPYRPSPERLAEVAKELSERQCKTLGTKQVDNPGWQATERTSRNHRPHRPVGRSRRRRQIHAHCLSSRTTDHSNT